MSFRVAVLVSGEGTNLQALLDSVHRQADIEIVCVASSNPSAPALERARNAGVEAAVFAAADHRDRAARDEALGGWLAQRRIDLVVSAGFMELLDPFFVRRFQGRIINVHPSLLPAFPGVRPVEEALAYGVRVTGVTVHFMDEGIDSGPVILQEALPLPYPRALEEVEELLHEIEHRLLPRAVRLIARGAVRLDPERPRQVLVDEHERVGD